MMKFIRICWLMFAVLIVSSCDYRHQPFQASAEIILYPIGNVSPDIKVYALNRLKRIFPNVRLLKNQPLIREAYCQPRNRYRADSIINYLSKKARENEVYVGITETDISTTNPERKVNDWGVMGLGLCPGNASVTSSYRLKDKTKENFFKIVIHELGHNAGLPHCKTQHCYMHDAEGQDNTASENGFCSKCLTLLREKGWNI